MAIKIAGVTVIGDTRSLSSITSLDAQTVNTIETAIAVGPNTMTDVQVSGISTFVNGPVLIGGGTTTGITSTVLQVVGVNSSVFIGGNLGINSTIPGSRLTVGGDVSISGVATAVTFNGQVNQPTGVSTFATLTTQSGAAGTITVNSNLFVSGNITAGGTSIVLNAAQLQIADRDIVLGLTTNAQGNDVSTDSTANHGGIAVASTVGSPLINIPLQVGVNSNPSTYKQFMWMQSGNYSGLGTDTWITNYPISIGNTSRVLVNSRFTVGTGYTVFDTLLDATDIKGRNSNFYGITTSTAGLFAGTGTTTGTAGQVFQVVGVNSSVFIGGNLGLGHTNPTQKFDVIGNANFTGIVTATVFNGNLNATGVSTFNPGSTVLIGTATSTGTASQVLQVAGVSSSAYIGGRTGIGTTNPAAQFHVTPASSVNAGLFSGTTSSDMVRITQSGTGNAIFSSNLNRAPFIVTNDNRVAIGTTAMVPGTSLTVLDGNTSILTGAGIGGTTAPAGYVPLAAYVGTAGSTAEVLIQNVNNLPTSSSDLCLLSDTATWVNNYIDLGINGSTYNQSFWQVGGPNDGYLYTSDGSLSLGANWNSVQSGKYINFFINGTTLNYELMRINTTGVGIGTTIPNGLLQVGTGSSTLLCATFAGIGSVGIANTQPASTLDVTGTFRVSSGSTFSGAVVLGSTLTQGNSAATFQQSSAAFTVGSQTTGTLTLGGTAQTGTLTLGRSTATQTTNIQAGASGVGTTKTINIGTGGVSGSFTYITLGSAAGLSTIFINTSDFLGIGSATPTSILDVVGDAKVTGVVTATAFNGNFNSGAAGVGTITTLSGTTLNYSGVGTVNFINGTGLRYTGMSTFAAGSTVLIGTGTSTGTAGQILQVAGVSSSVYIGGQLGIGVTTPGAPLQINSNASATAVRAFSGATANNVSYTLGRTSEEIFLGIAANPNDFIAAATAGDFILKNNSGKLMFGASGTNALTIDTNNNVLINVANSTGTANQALQVGSATTVRGAYISGSVGIGSTIPATTLDVAGTGRFTGIVTATVFNGNLNATGVSTFNPGSTVLIGTATSTGTANQVLQVAGVSSSAYIGGQLGIGVISPTTTLDVSGTGRFTGIVTATVFNGNLNATGMSTFAAGSTVLIGTGNSTGTAGQILQVAGVSSSVYIGGSVGIGTTNPSANLHSVYSATTAPSLNFGGTAGQIFRNELGEFAFGLSNAAPFPLWIQGRYSNNTARDIVLNPLGGNFVIGTTFSTGTASQPLQVTGSAYFSGALGIGTTNSAEQIHSRTNFASSYIRLDNSSGIRAYYGVNTSQDVEVNAADNANLVFKTFGTERARFNTSGNLGIGTTNPIGKLQVSGGNILLDNNTLSSGANYIGFGTNNISRISGRDNDSGGLGFLAFLPSGTEAARFNASGNLGVGVTNPGNKLVVGGETAQFPYSLQVLSTLHATSRRASIGLGGTIGTQTPDWQLLIDSSGNGTKDLSFYSTALNSSVFNIQTSGNSVFQNYPVIIGSATSTGTASQPLQVTGGAYISGSVGIGTTITSSGGLIKLNVVGATAISGVSTTFTAITQNIAKFLILSTQTTTGTATTLTSDGSNIPSSATGNVHLIPANAAIAFKGTVVANVTGGGNTRAWEFKGLIKRGAAASSTVLVGTPAISDIAFDAGASGWAISVGADTNVGAIAVNVTGQAATTIRWVCKMESTEVTY